ncbi:hypothetical protein [Castellaniella sp. GW247-6E4]|uniref:hypothetical protein n=1 Tax=Castellaniella sp. GW247-6E4 TaxID=3140380 RepID=UPI0033159615
MTTETVLSDRDKMKIAQAIHHEKLGVMAAIDRVEQAVLQSPEIQALRKDAEQLDWLEKHFTDVSGIYKDACGEVLSFFVDCEGDSLADGDQGRIRAAISAAMENGRRQLS